MIRGTAGTDVGAAITEPDVRRVAIVTGSIQRQSRNRWWLPSDHQPIQQPQ